MTTNKQSTTLRVVRAFFVVVCVIWLVTGMVGYFAESYFGIGTKAVVSDTMAHAAFWLAANLFMLKYVLR